MLGLNKIVSPEGSQCHGACECDNQWPWNNSRFQSDPRRVDYSAQLISLVSYATNIIIMCLKPRTS